LIIHERSFQNFFKRVTHGRKRIKVTVCEITYRSLATYTFLKVWGMRQMESVAKNGILAFRLFVGLSLVTHTF